MVQAGEVIATQNESMWFDWLEVIFKYQSGIDRSIVVIFALGI
jgi:hypothetical protein